MRFDRIVRRRISLAVRSMSASSKHAPGNADENLLVMLPRNFSPFVEMSNAFHFLQGVTASEALALFVVSVHAPQMA